MANILNGQVIFAQVILYLYNFISWKRWLSIQFTDISHIAMHLKVPTV